jgi:hypothetical protein
VIRHSTLVATWAAAALEVPATDPVALRIRDGALQPATLTEIVIGANLVYSPARRSLLEERIDAFRATSHELRPVIPPPSRQQP